MAWPTVNESFDKPDESLRLPLSGLKIVDLTIAMAGPLATQRLADMGADVIKVEVPGTGDLTRVFALSGLRLGDETTSFLALNRNKRSIALNLKSEKGLNILLDLVESADVLIQNFRPGVADRLGLGYVAVCERNPAIIYCSISGYGNQGPMAGRPGQDLLVQAFSGMMFNAGTADGPPHPAPVYLVDTCASHLATSAILAGLYQRSRDSCGQHVEVSLLGAALEIQSQEIMTYLSTGELADRSSAPFASAWLAPPYGVYKTRDSWIAFAQNDIGTIAEQVDSRVLAECYESGPGEGNGIDDQAWRESLYELLQKALIENTTEHWADKLSEQGVWCGPVYSYAELAAHPQSKTFFRVFEHPSGGKISAVAPAIQFSAADDAPMQPPPALGEHTDTILSGIGFDEMAITRLRSEGDVA